jgi:copper oxidase (laccase) domain-containing protein
MPNKFTTEEKVEIAKLNEERRMYLIKRYGESCYVKSKNKNGEDVYYIDLYQTMKNILTRIGFEEENIILDKNVNTSDGNFPAYTNRGGDSGRNFVIVTPVA